MQHIQLIEGPLSTTHISILLDRNAQIMNIGAYTIFCGQVRADKFENKNVKGIEYTCYESMAIKILKDKIEILKNQFNIQEIFIIHSNGYVPVGGLSVILFITSSHRQQALEAQQAFLPIIKFEVPIWKKEIFEDASSRWI